MFLWLAVVRFSGQRGAQNEIEMAEQRPPVPTIPNQPKEDDDPDAEEGEEGEERVELEIEKPLVNYRQTSRFVCSMSLLAMCVFFGTTAYMELLVDQRTSSLSLHSRSRHRNESHARVVRLDSVLHVLT